MSVVEDRLAELGIELPAPRPAAGNYRGYVWAGDLLFTAGQGADGHIGTVGHDVTIEQAQEAARASALNVLAQVKAALGSLDRVEKVVKLVGYVRATPDFDQHPKVLDGASNVIVDIFGPEVGPHARTAVGAGSLPKNFSVEVELIVQVAGG